jgi:negative regulator of sigma-B (phosphoserine phosphatase)
MSAPLLDWGWAGHAIEVESGDLHFVQELAGGVLIALVDGLGHGPEAAAAAAAAIAELETRAGSSVTELLQQCHAALRKTRGVAMSVASFTAADHTMAWAGIGNVDGLLLRSGSPNVRAGIPLRGGVVGYQMPVPRVDIVALEPFDLVVLATDGIGANFTMDLPVDAVPSEIARSILQRFAKGNDDARVLVARYNGLKA